MRAGFLAAVLLCAAPVARSQPAVTVKELKARLEALRVATDFRASGRLVAVAASGERRSYRISLRARWLEGALKMFCEIAEPPPARVRLLLESRPGSLASIRKGHAGDRQPVTVPFESWATACWRRHSHTRTCWRTNSTGTSRRSPARPSTAPAPVTS